MITQSFILKRLEFDPIDLNLSEHFTKLKITVNNK